MVTDVLQSSEFTLQSLSQLLGTLHAAGTRIEALLHRAAEEEPLVDHAIEEARRVHAATLSLVEDARDHTDALGDQALAALDELGHTLGEAAQRLEGESARGVAAVEEILGAAMEAEREATADLVSTTESALGEWLEATAQAVQETSASIAELQAEGSALVSAVTELSRQTAEVHAEVTEGLRSFGQALGEEWPARLHQTFQHLGETVEESARAALASGVEGVRAELEAGLADFQQWVTDQARAWSEGATEAARAVIHHVLDSLQHALKDAIDAAIEHGIQLLASEVALQLGLMEVGASVTAVLAPILPELVAAKLALTALNSVLDVFGL